MDEQPKNTRITDLENVRDAIGMAFLRRALARGETIEFVGTGITITLEDYNRAHPDDPIIPIKP